MLHREVVVTLTVCLISNAYFDARNAGKNVKLGKSHVRHGVDLYRVASLNCIEPTAAALATGGYTVFAARLAQKLAGFVMKLCRERTGANARDVRLSNAQDLADCLRTHTRTGGRAASAAGRRGYEGIGAMVDVEHGALSAFEQHVLASTEFRIQQLRGFGHMIAHNVGVGEIHPADLINRIRFKIIDLGKDLVL